MNYYIYYRAAPGQEAELRRAVEFLFLKVERHCGVRGRWLRRHDDPGTFMEVYENVGDAQGFEALMAREASGFAVERKVERFISLEKPS